jgi:hypothetical protein
LLNGSKFNYVLLGSPANASTLTRVVLMAKTGPDVPGATPEGPQQALNQPGNNLAPPPQDGTAIADTPDAEAVDETPDDNSDQNAAAEAEQPAVPPPDQAGIKTPQQMLQEMQQRQLQMQQQQPPGQPPIPGGGYPQPPRPQPEQQ